MKRTKTQLFLDPKDHGGPAFPSEDDEQYLYGISVLDYFASQAMNLPISEIQDVSQCDDEDLLERFGTEKEKQIGFTPVSGGNPVPFKNIELRARLESRARAEIRYIEAEAMLDKKLERMRGL